MDSDTVVVTEAGFRPGDPAEVFVHAVEADEGTGPLRIELAADGDPASVVPHFARTGVIRIPFRSFADGRGFTLARELRRLGYGGRIRATGHVISDQWRMARACGIDEVEISVEQARRQPEPAWGTGAGRLGYLDVLR
jgi:uncharacterized protein (DUF934 family)